MPAKPALQASWIWLPGATPADYNSTILARRRFTLPALADASLIITADTWYRLFINGRWVCDGPARSWPEHYQYDHLDPAPYLQPGDNEITVIARYFGTGTFHSVPLHPGLLLQLNARTARGARVTLATDASWEVAPARGWIADTPKISIQMEPAEWYDARRATPRFRRAAVLFPARGGPWLDLNPRDCRLLERAPRHIRTFVGAHVVERPWRCFTFPLARITHPGLIEANHAVNLACCMATVLRAPRAMRVAIDHPELDVTLDGRVVRGGHLRLGKGDNFLFATPRHYFGHHKDVTLRIADLPGVTLVNPLDPSNPSPWCCAPVTENDFVDDDLVAFGYDTPDRAACKLLTSGLLQFLLATVRSPRDLVHELGASLRSITPTDDPHAAFRCRRVLPRTQARIDSPAAVIADNPEFTTVHPSPAGDVELVYDLGEQRCGYWEVELLAPAGTVVDIFGVEYIDPATGAVQHTHDNRNGLRYICREGANRFLSLKRRSARHLFVTLRSFASPVRLRLLRVVESAYPVEHTGCFRSDNPSLDRIWTISARTLELCMEDTFTDCPLYEQTLWVGDARNEALFAYTAFGAPELARRCLTLAGQSLDRYPLVGCQVPSSWDILLPAWSFLWGIAVWEYYWYSGDRDFLARSWKWVEENLRGAEDCTDTRGLFGGPFWNLLDWADIDQGHRVVTHNTLLLIGAINAAIESARALGRADDARRLRRFRARCTAGVNSLWNAKKGAYADAIRDDGAVSPRTCQHNLALALVHDALPPRHVPAAVGNLLRPPSDMTRAGSPFASMFVYEALEKTGHAAAIVPDILRNYAPMLEADASTVWETFPGHVGPAGFPTRSHCHAWSSAPVHFLNRVVLGIRQTRAAGAAYEISPRPCGLSRARGASVGIRGPVRVCWEVKGREMLIDASAPAGATLRFHPNPDLAGLKVRFNGSAIGRQAPSLGRAGG